MNIDFVSNQDDWVIIYIDGTAKYAGHDVPMWLIRELILKPATLVRDWFVLGEDIMNVPTVLNFDEYEKYNLSFEAALTLDSSDLEEDNG